DGRARRAESDARLSLRGPSRRFRHHPRGSREGGAGLPFPAPLSNRLHFERFSARASSIARVTFGDSGLSAGSKRATTSPLRSTKNFAKFQGISPANLGLVFSLFRNWYKGWIPAPLTAI